MWLSHPSLLFCIFFIDPFLFDWSNRTKYFHFLLLGFEMWGPPAKSPATTIKSLENDRNLMLCGYLTSRLIMFLKFCYLLVVLVLPFLPHAANHLPTYGTTTIAQQLQHHGTREFRLGEWASRQQAISPRNVRIRVQIMEALFDHPDRLQLRLHGLVCEGKPYQLQELSIQNMQPSP